MPKHSRGVVLLIVLLAIVVVTATLAQVAQTTSQVQISVLESSRELQQRWGMTTCHRAILPSTLGVLKQLQQVSQQTKTRDQRRQAAPDSVADQVVLGDLTFNLLCADEDAKLNLNALYHLGSIAACERTISEVLPLKANRLISLRPRIRSLSEQTAADSRSRSSRLAGEDSDQDELGEETTDKDDFEDFLGYGNPSAFKSWGEVFDLARFPESGLDVRDVAEMTSTMTLWGSQRLNVWRASDDEIIAICRPIVQDGVARRIAERLRKTSLSQIKLVLSQTVTNPRDREELGQVLADTSQCASLWIESGRGRDRRQRLSIQTLDESGFLISHGFEFH